MPPLRLRSLLHKRTDNSTFIVVFWAMRLIELVETADVSEVLAASFFGVYYKYEDRRQNSKYRNFTRLYPPCERIPPLTWPPVGNSCPCPPHLSSLRSLFPLSTCSQQFLHLAQRPEEVSWLSVTQGDHQCTFILCFLHFNFSRRS